MGKKTISNAFESELAVALRTAAVQAVVNLVNSNPNLSLEDFYAIIRPQGFSETITIAELALALSGKLPKWEVEASRSSAALTTVRPKATKPKSAKPKKAARAKVNCRTKEGQKAYYASIISYLRDVGDWVGGSEIRKHCGGGQYQSVNSLRHLVEDEIVERRGETFGSEWRLASKHRKKISYAEADASDEVNASTHAGRASYYNSIVQYLKKSKSWKSGPEISEHCGGNKGQRNRMLDHLIEDGLVVTNGVLRTGKRYRAL